MLRREIAWLLVWAATAAAQVPDPAVMAVKGIGAEGRPPYAGGGVVRFRALRLGAQVVHDAGDGRLLVPLSIDYTVEETAPIILSSFFGSEYWQLHDLAADQTVVAHSRERIDLRAAGDATAEIVELRIDARRGSPVTAGLLVWRGRSYFLIEPPQGEWLDVAQPPIWFEQDAQRRLQVTVADLTSYRLGLGAVRSRWRAGDTVRVRLEVSDHQSRRLPVVGCRAELRAGDDRVALETERDLLDCPTGWLTGRLPDTVADAWRFSADVRLATPGGLRTEAFQAMVTKGTGAAEAAVDERAALGDPELPRRAGQPLETRALWVALHNLRTPEAVADVVDRAAAAGLNVLLPDIFLRDEFLAARGGFPLDERVAPGFDPLAALLDAGHALGMEVHPWFCVTYRDAAARARIGQVDLVNANGGVREIGADVHRPAFRDFMVDLMVGVARDYPVDGIHLDYIRAMEDCYCPACRAEFAARFGKPLTAATEADWQAWHREAIGDIVQRTAAGVRAARPGAVMSAAVFSGRASGARQGQDPVGWAKAGWVDWVIPMDYTGDSLALRSNERALRDDLGDPARLLPGLSLDPRHGERAMRRPSELVTQQIRVIRGLQVAGYCLFVDDYLHGEVIDAVKALNDPPAAPRKPE